MGETSKIEWTDATWNPVTGCTKVSPGCDHCYAESIAERFRGGKAWPNGFDVQVREKRLHEPFRWKTPKRVFVNSMSDLFHEAIPDDYIEQVWDVMEQAKQHTFQVLTKRHARLRAFLKRRHARDVDYAVQFSYCPTEAMRTSPAAQWAQSRVERPWSNVWVGVSVEDQKWADIRIPALIDTPATTRFLSCEPLLGPLDLRSYLASGDLHWVIVGGESGARARPMDWRWAHDLNIDCHAYDVPFFFKQWGSHDEHGKRMSKHDAGRLLDGRTWDEYPQTDAAGAV